MAAALAAVALAQFGATVAFDPSVARQNTALVVLLGETALSSDGRPATSLAVALPRGMRLDTRARERLCTRGEAARSACPTSSRIGFGRFAITVRGHAAGEGTAELVWWLEAFLARPLRPGDPASVALTGRLLGADTVAALLEPSLGTDVPSTTTTIGRLVRTSGAYGIELSFPTLPARLDAAPPVTAMPSRLDLSLSAVRRTRQSFTRRIRVRTLDGYEVRRVKDHRLVGHYLLRAPRRCRGSWRAELRVGFPSGVKRTASRIPCSRGL